MARRRWRRQAGEPLPEVAIEHRAAAGQALSQRVFPLRFGFTWKAARLTNRLHEPAMTVPSSNGARRRALRRRDPGGSEQSSAPAAGGESAPSAQDGGSGVGHEDGAARRVSEGPAAGAAPQEGELELTQQDGRTAVDADGRAGSAGDGSGSTSGVQAKKRRHGKGQQLLACCEPLVA